MSIPLGRASLSWNNNTIHRRYLGDPQDPHFRPASPLVSRQQFSSLEEEELRRACTRALSHVPHSNETGEEDLQQLAKYIIVAAPREHRHKKEKSVQSQQSARSQRSATSTIASGHKSHVTRQHHNDTSTPSERSRKDRTNETTPLTSAAITPDKTRKQIFAPSSRSNTAADDSSLPRVEKPTSGQRSKHSPQKQENISTIRLVKPPSRSMTNLHSGREENQPPAVPVSQLGSEHTFLNISNPGFNKSLPELPQVSQASHTSMSIFDLARTKSKSRSSGRPDIHRAHTTPAAPSNKNFKSKIFSIFQRKRSQPA